MMETFVDTTKETYQPICGIRAQVHEELISRFLSHVTSSPDSIAIMTSERSFTYQMLYTEVIRWKAFLRPQLTHKTVVCLNRSPRLLSVLLALQWLEIIYIPVEVTTPTERLRAIIEDSQAEAIIYDLSTHDRYASLPCQKIGLSENAPLPIVQGSEEEPIFLQKPSIAYIIYTSGSTGKPKGVAVSRFALNNFLTSMSHYFLREEQGILLAITSIAFDIAALELYLPIWQKKRVFIASHEEHKDPFHIKKILKDHPITLLQATPSMWKMICNGNWEGGASLVALSGGEPLTPVLAQALLNWVSSLWNMYGPLKRRFGAL